MQMRKTFPVHILIPLLLSVLLAEGCAEIFVSTGLARHRSKATIESENRKNRELWESLVPGITSWTDSLMAVGAMKDTFIFYDCCLLHAKYVPSEVSTRRTAVVVHGYDAGPYNVMMLVRMYRDSLGFNVLAPSLRHLGNSGGDYVQMGWNDRLDVLHWSEVAHEIFDDTLQVLHGVSMGAATVMMASGEDTPDYVRGFIEDCGYSSVWEELVYASDHYVKLDSAFVGRVEKVSVKRFGLDFHEASSLNQLARCRKPMLFIHGDADVLVPVYMAERNFEAKIEGYKEMWIAPGSAHARSYPDYPAQYTDRVRNFLLGHVICNYSPSPLKSNP